MRCAICLLESKKPSYQDVAVVAGYSICDGHLKEWAMTGHPTVSDWILDRKGIVEVVEIPPELEDVVHPKSESVAVEQSPGKKPKRRGRPRKNRGEKV